MSGTSETKGTTVSLGFFRGRSPNSRTRIKQLLCKHLYELKHVDSTQWTNVCGKCGHATHTNMKNWEWTSYGGYSVPSAEETQ